MRWRPGLCGKDFFYRIRVFEISLPALRERREDLPLLVSHFVAEGSTVYPRAINDIAQDAMQQMLKYAWPGNIRELRNAIEHAFVTAEGGCLTVLDLPPEIRTPTSSASKASITEPLTPEQQAERDRILEALRETRGSKTKAARLLGYSRVTLWKKLQQFGIQGTSSQVP